MMRKLGKRILTVVLSASMVLGSFTMPIFAEESSESVVMAEVETTVETSTESIPAVEESAEVQTEIQSAEPTEAQTEIQSETETESVTETETETETAEVELPKSGNKGEEIKLEAEEQPQIEINQGMSIHVQNKGKDETYMNDFVAKKKTVVMMRIPGSDASGYTKENAEEVVKNYSLECKAVTNGSEAENNELSCDGSCFSVMQAYDRDGDPTKPWYAVASFPTGPDKGSYNFHIYETKDGNKTEVSVNKGVNFFDTQTLNILVVPVKAYWDKKYDGGAPSDKCVASVTDLKYTGLDGSTEQDWGSLAGNLKSYLLDVYPVADINIEVGQEVDASDASYDMCNEADANGQKKLWEEVCKLQTKDKSTGKDKYDLILAFVAYRQDKGGGQGYTFGKPTNIITYLDKDMFPTVAHEIAHCYQVGDEYDGGSFNPDVNQSPSGYKGRNFVSGDENYSPSIENADYWQSPKQYAAAKGKSGISESGLGTMVSLSLHPYSLSKGEFIKWASESTPTISYMGSGYSGNYGYYWTSSVIWEHLFKELMVKEKQENSGEGEQSAEEGAASGTLSNADVYYIGLEASEGKNVAVQPEKEAVDETSEEITEETTEETTEEETEETTEELGLEVLESMPAEESEEEYYVPATSIFDAKDFYFEDGYREGESRMLEVSGWLVNNGGRITVEMDPMFSYEGDLSYMDYEKVPDASVYSFAALDADGKVIVSPVDSEGIELAVTEFNGNFYNASMNKKLNYVNFNFDAEYPEGTAEIVIVKGKIPEGWTKNSEAKNYMWSSADEGLDTSKNLDGYLTYAGFDEYEYNGGKFSYGEIEWEVDYEDAIQTEEEAPANKFYTEVYYCPQGDDGDVIFVADSEDGYIAPYNYLDDNGVLRTTDDWEEGYAYIDTAKYGWSKDAYIWVKVTDGINGFDIFSDENDVSINYSTITLSGAGLKNAVDPKTKEVSYNVEYTGAAIAPNAAVKVVDPMTGATLTLKKDVDYRISYQNNINPGTATVVIEGIGIYPGRNTAEFTINPKSLKTATPQQIPDAVFKTGVDKTIKKNIVLYDNKSNQLTLDTDFTVVYGTELKAGSLVKSYKTIEGDDGLYKSLTFKAANGKDLDFVTVTAVFTGKGMYKDVCNKKMTFKLYKEGYAAKIISTATVKDITLKVSSMQYTGKALKPGIKSITLNSVKKNAKGEVVTDKNGNPTYETLPAGKYQLVYTDNVNVGKGKITIVGKNGYVGSISTTFDIVPKEVTAITVTGVVNQPIDTANFAEVKRLVEAYGTETRADEKEKLRADIVNKLTANMNIVVKANGLTLVRDVDYTIDINPECNYCDFTTAIMKAKKETPQLIFKLKDKSNSAIKVKSQRDPVVVWKSTVKEDKKALVKTYSIIQANLASSAATTVSLKNSKAVNELKINDTKYTVTAVTDKKLLKSYAFVVEGEANKMTVGTKDTIDITNALVVKYLGNNLDAKYYSVAVTTTKDGAIGKITLKPTPIKITEVDKTGKEKITTINPYKGNRVIKFKYVMKATPDDESETETEED